MPNYVWIADDCGNDLPVLTKYEFVKKLPSGSYVVKKHGQEYAIRKCPSRTFYEDYDALVAAMQERALRRICIHEAAVMRLRLVVESGTLSLRIARADPVGPRSKPLKLDKD